MAGIPQGLATFPGIEHIRSASINFIHGIRPAVATVTIAPQLGFVGEGGTLKFSYNDEVIAEFPDAKIDYNSFEPNATGEVWRLSIRDRRWKWAWGSISGWYNVHNADGTIRDGTAKTPQELASLCLDAIGEVGYHIGDMPNDATIEVEWDDTPPMEALADLCDTLGCRVVLQFDNKVAVRVGGVGAELPINDDLMENSLTINPPEKPDEIVIAFGPNRYQVDLELEAVGIDNDDDNTILPIADLDYAPAAGWGFGEHPEDNIDVQADRELAKKSVFRMYRVTFPIDVDGFPQEQVEDINHLLIESEQVATKIEHSVLKNKPAEVLGVWFPGGDALENTAVDTLCPRERPFSLDVKRGILIFGQPIYQRSSSGAAGDGEAATLKLRTAVSIRRKNTLLWQRSGVSRQTGGNFNTPTQYVRHKELQLGFIDGTKQNEDDLIAEANFFLDGIERLYDVVFPQSIKYAGLLKIELDGAIQQVIYGVGEQGATTTVARNNELLRRTVPFTERRKNERLRAIAWARGDRVVKDGAGFPRIINVAHLQPIG